MSPALVLLEQLGEGVALAAPPEGSLASSGNPGGAVSRPKTLSFGIPSIDGVLPDGGLPRGAVVEVASARGLGQTTSFALAACAAAQAEARLRSGDDDTVGAWCAFLDPFATLHAPGVLRAGVDLGRLLVARPSIDALPRIAVRMAASRAFSLVVIDTARLPGETADGVSLDRWATVVRRLALSIERSDTTVLLLTDRSLARSAVLPVAMRVELERRILRVPSGESRSRPGPTILRVGKERRGRVGSSGPIDLRGPIDFERRAS